MKGARNVFIHTKKTAILRACNSLLRAIEEDSDIPNLHLDFSTKEASSTLNGLFLNNGIRGMLEGKDYRNLDYVYPFVMAYVDRITNCINNGLTEVNTIYSDILYTLYHTITVRGLTPHISSNLQSLIKTFKSKCVNLFSPFVDKGLFSLKFHLLDHLMEDLRKYGNLDFLDAGPYENYNFVIKEFYRMTSKRKKTAFSEVIQKMNSNNIIHNTQEERNLPSNKKENTQQHLVRDGFTITLRELRCFLQSHATSNILRLKQELLSVIPESDVPVLTKLVEEELDNLIDPIMDHDVVLTVVKSGFIDSFTTPSLSSYDKERNVVLFEETLECERIRKRVVASSAFGSSKKKKFSSVFLKGSDDGKLQQFWFAKTMLLFHLKIASLRFHKELALVKYYTCTPPRDHIDSVLNCVNLRWETEDNIDYTINNGIQNESITASENYGLVSFQSICGEAHVVRANYAVHPFTKEIPWTHHRFYINRFIP